MPRIAPYQQQTRTPRPIAQGVDLGSGDGTAAIGRALESVAEDQARLQLFARRKEEERDAVAANERIMSLKSSWAEEFPKRQREAPEDAQGFALSVLQDFDTQADEAIEQTQTERGRAFMKQRLSEYRLSLQQAALGFEAQRNVEFKVNGLNRSADQARIAAEFRPEDFPTLAAEQLAAIEASGLSAEAQASLIQDGQLKIASAAVQGMIRQDPYAALKELNNEDTQSLPVRALSFDQRQQLRGAAEAEIRRRETDTKARQSEARQALSERVRDATAAYRMGLDFDAPPSRAEFIAALGADDGNQAYEAFTKEQQLGPAIRALATSSDAEQEDLLAQFAPAGTAGVADAAERYNILVVQADRLRAQRDSDPAAYVARYNSRVQSLLSASDDSPEAAQAYATASIAEQKRLGVSQPKILPDDVASAIAQSFHAQGAEQSAVLIQTEREKWGSHWPQVFGQLAEKKIPAAALAIGRGMELGAATRLASVAAIPIQELEKGLTTTPKEVREQVNTLMLDFGLTLDGVTGGEHTFSAMHEAVTRLSLSYLRQGKGLSDATEQAYSEVLGDHYAFYEVNNRQFRVPVEHDAPGIEIGARRELAQIKAAELRAPVPTGSSSPEQATEDLARIIRSRGYWVTSREQERGLTLFLDGNPVLRKDGSVYEIGFDELATTAAERREDIDRRLQEEARRQQERGF